MNALQRLEAFGIEKIELADVIAYVAKFTGSMVEGDIKDNRLTLMSNHKVVIMQGHDMISDYPTEYRTERNTIVVLEFGVPVWGGRKILKEIIGRKSHAGLTGDWEHQIEELLSRQ